MGNTVLAVFSGGITITAQNTNPTATKLDPWTFTEHLTADGIVSLTNDIDGFVLQIPGPTGLTLYGSGAWFQKTVRNDSAVAWTSFEIELRVDPAIPSPDGDGLSFAQGNIPPSVFSSDKFSTYTRQDTTRDYLNFHGGSVAVGETVTFLFAVTDNDPRTPIYLKETPNKAELAFSCGDPPDGVLNVAYTHTFPVVGGVAPYLYDVESGSLPPGLTLTNPVDFTGNDGGAIVAGTPTTVGTYNFQLRVQVTEGTNPFSIIISCSITIDSGTSLARLQIFDDGAGEFIFDTPLSTLLVTGSQNAAHSNNSGGAVGPFILPAPLAITDPGLVTIQVSNVNPPENPTAGNWYLAFVFAIKKKCEGQLPQGGSEGFRNVKGVIK